MPNPLTYTGTGAPFVETAGISIFRNYFGTAATWLATGGTLFARQYWGTPAVFNMGVGTSHVPYARGVIATSGVYNWSMGISTFDSNTTVFKLDPNWKFSIETDLTGASGIANGWHTEGFDDSSWTTLVSGKTWESQGVTWAGYGWYRQKMTLPIPATGKPLSFTLGTIVGDDVMYFNGVQIGGRRGNFQYTNNYTRVYTVPASAVHKPPTPNTLAVRTWGGYLSQRPGSGLEKGPSGAYSVLATFYRPHARLTGGSEASEVPVEAFDMSACQNGLTWELVIRLNAVDVTLNPASIAYIISDFYKVRLTSGEAPVVLGGDGIYRGIISIDAPTSQTLYFAGRFQAQWQVVVPGSVSPLPDPTLWTDTGWTITTTSGGYIMEVWKRDFPAGTIQLPAQASGTFSGMYNVLFLDPTVVVSNLIVHDTANAAAWSIQTDLEIGDLVSGDYPYTMNAMSPQVIGAPTWIQTSVRSKSVTINPIASVDIDRPATVYISVDKRVSPLPWSVITLTSLWADTSETMGVAKAGFTEEIYTQDFVAGTIQLPAQASGPITGMYNVFIQDPTVNVTNLVVNDPVWYSSWSIQQNLQVGSLTSGDEIYTFTSVPDDYLGSTYIQTAEHSKFTTNNPIAQFDIDQDTTISIGVDRRVTKLPWTHSWTADHLRFDSRDTTILSPLSPQFDVTPYGTLKLNDIIDCSTSLLSEVHPYMQSSFTQATQRACTPGAQVTVTVSTILGKQARSSGFGWFAYKIGRGGLDPNKTYLLRVEYPEDVPRYGEVTVECGTNKFDVGWQNGFGPSDIYEPWPLSGQWQFYDIIIPLGIETTDAMGSLGGSTTTGVWIYLLNKVSPSSYWNIYSGGPAVATLRLYEIDPFVNAPVIQYPLGGAPQRVLTFDWEREPMIQPNNVCAYGKLMGYSAISPISTIKWNVTHWGDPIASFDNMNIDAQNYYTDSKYTIGSHVPPAPAIAGKPSVHQAFLSATAALGINYIPRYEYGGGNDLQVAARSVNANGTTAKPSRFFTWGANLLHPDTFAEIQATFDGIVAPYAATNPQFKGIIWRQRSDRLQISYGGADAVLYSNDTGTPLPAGFGTMTPAQIGQWCAVTQYPAYANWWHTKRRDFHEAVAAQLLTYRSDLILYYYNWETDKFSITAHDRNSGGFYADLAANGPGWYATEAAVRATKTAQNYIDALTVGDFSSAVTLTRPDNPYPDYGLRPSLYHAPGLMLLAPVNTWCYAKFPDYVNYFQTDNGLAVTNCVPYDEIAAGLPNPNYAGTMVTPACGPFSMAMEVMSYFHGDVKMLTWTPYTFGRGFADAHRKFAQAFLSLPAVSGSLVASGDPDVAARVYNAGGFTYVGVAHKGFAAKTIHLSISGSWPAYAAITNQVTLHTTVVAAGAMLPLVFNSGPMELNSFLISSSSAPPVGGIVWQVIGEIIT